jgi:hypothetical protein
MLLSKVELMEKSYRKRDNKEVKRISTPDSINPSNSTNKKIHKLHRT